MARHPDSQEFAQIPSKCTVRGNETSVLYEIELQRFVNIFSSLKTNSYSAGS